MTMTTTGLVSMMMVVVRIMTMLMMTIMLMMLLRIVAMLLLLLLQPLLQLLLLMPLLLTPLLAEPVLAVYLATTDFPSSVRKSAPTATVAVAAMKNKTARRSACCRWRVRSVEARQAASSFRGWPLGWLRMFLCCVGSGGARRDDTGRDHRCSDGVCGWASSASRAVHHLSQPIHFLTQRRLSGIRVHPLRAAVTDSESSDREVARGASSTSGA